MYGSIIGAGSALFDKMVNGFSAASHHSYMDSNAFSINFKTHTICRCGKCMCGKLVGKTYGACNWHAVMRTLLTHTNRFSEIVP